MIPGARLILLGRQGAGKGTQCVRLSRHFVVPHISTGDMLRAAVREGSELGMIAKAVMDDGGLVGDEIMIALVRQRLTLADAIQRGYVLDGFPRTVGQAEALDEITERHPIDVVIDLDVPRELVLQRLSSRRVCQDCGTNYVAAADRVLTICEVCGGSIQQRADDTPEAIAHRLDLYEEQTQPLIAFYQRTGRLMVVDGVAAPDEVFRRLTAAVD
ncbi:MAG TPA: adenylate kinase, partial [Ilumatobacteraceae bacterium]|nr:adenylate kinase [Ilumatobacteraceae bacterium]